MSYDELMRDIERALVAIDDSKPYRYEPTTSLPALSPQMRAALDAEAEMVASVVKRAREMADELLAARADFAAVARVLPPCCGSLADAAQEVVDERDDARADLREAMELLDMAEVPPDHENGGDLELWNHRRAVLRGAVEKRKETP